MIYCSRKDCVYIDGTLCRKDKVYGCIAIDKYGCDSYTTEYDILSMELEMAKREVYDAYKRLNNYRKYGVTHVPSYWCISPPKPVGMTDAEYAKVVEEAFKAMKKKGNPYGTPWW